MQRVIISGGGTGGHIFPAVSIAQTLKKRYPEIEILFIGADGRMEMTKVPQAGFQIKGLPVRGLYRKQVWRNIGVLWDFLRSLTMARDIIRAFRPQVVIGVGGYASAPTLKAAQSLGIKTLIQEQNSYAGVSNKLLSRRADKICVAYPDMERFFPADRIVQTGNPIRSQIEYMGDIDRGEALAYFGLSSEVSKVVLVVGGSLGARTINKSIARYLEDWGNSGVALIWQTGTSYQEEAQSMQKDYKGELYCNAFIERMDLAYHLADLVISRAGASSISELCLLGKPTILIPSPNVAEDHQTKNALALSERGAAVLIPDVEAEAKLTSTALTLVRDRAKLEALSKNILALAYHKAADKIVDEVIALVKEG